MSKPQQVMGICPECKKGTMVLEKVETADSFPTEYSYKCNSCGYTVVEN